MNAIFTLTQARPNSVHAITGSSIHRRRQAQRASQTGSRGNWNNGVHPYQHEIRRISASEFTTSPGQAPSMSTAFI